MDITIKKATTNNLKDIQKLNLELFRKEYKEFDNTLNCDWTFSKKGEKYFKDALTKKNELALIALDNKKIVGYLVGGIQNVSKVRLLKKLAELENMFILPEYRSQGIGTRLVNEFLAWCKSKSIKKVRVVASFKNKLGINFYKKNDFFEWDLVLEKNL